MDIRVYGLQRSGNHAIISWILHNLGKNYVLNRLGSLPGKATLDNKKNVVFFNDVSRTEIIKKPVHNKYKNYEYKIYSYEELYNNNKSFHKNKPIEIFIFRDFLNCYASRIKKKPKAGLVTCITRYVDLYQKYEELKQNPEIKTVLIKYNSWLMDKTYRDNISLELGIPNTVDNTKTVTAFGGGSSFIGKKLDKTDNYTNRYKILKLNNDHKINILNNKKLLEINEREFNIKIEEILNVEDNEK